ncbi:hypothetical protein GRAN_5218 [Granulicella sibirica]|uniref:Uncharacterized protein n=1 Tax=Granulicella sibirica TaxID=2479048 RepID=A0A4Q0SVF7_9BACT|nr:hypothetical protein GRAN_5218 [Granulicella sibirica]
MPSALFGNHIAAAPSRMAGGDGNRGTDTALTVPRVGGD